ncbi:hypothetical protein GUITHDRAFT_144446 [Guillardia theta CCMP2712]|uniref:Uncharacterized protein n=1 Tax=Guillardia theta (strain CCMP2712) TaxID=905079 RepID=L1IPW4_GUITC|nr:hypothetical protein GUITHDRAFT_144446 [Guillardia theta CCMP2712]EKX38137.1 hypothetical protein GUITHDRAFT_144446 [Guillardia theta CCMP2712]|eukprot:XP_005825117.1 hypothetical protein GUITHDRAFT_144446 [Guillardia theta CCMP2712]
MPHLIFQAKFPLTKEQAVISLYGLLEKQLIEDFKQCSTSVLQNALGSELPDPVIVDDAKDTEAPDQIKYCRSLLYPCDLPAFLDRHFTIRLPISIERRSILQNVLKIEWMDMFERGGWTLVSMWNTKENDDTTSESTKAAARKNNEAASSTTAVPMAIMTPVSSLPISSQSLAFSVAMPHSVSPELSASNPMLYNKLKRMEVYKREGKTAEKEKDGDQTESMDEEEETPVAKGSEASKRSADEDLLSSKAKKR